MKKQNAKNDNEERKLKLRNDNSRIVCGAKSEKPTKANIKFSLKTSSECRIVCEIVFM